MIYYFVNLVHLAEKVIELHSLPDYFFLHMGNVTIDLVYVAFLIIELFFHHFSHVLHYLSHSFLYAIIDFGLDHLVEIRLINRPLLYARIRQI